MQINKSWAAIGVGVLAVAGLVAWAAEHRTTARPKRAQPTGVIRPRDMADALHAVIAANRDVYNRVIVHRLQEQEKLIRASERWEADKALPVPAQMLRLGAEAVQTKGAEFSYTLRSLWPINRQNGPETEVEKQGLELVTSRPNENHYVEESLGGRRYLTAVYPDVAHHQACVMCHNQHPNSPKKDFKLGDVMGAIVVRVALEF
jgi:hypothetical protein